MDLETKPQEKTTSHFPPIWLTILITLIVLLSIFIPYRKKLHHSSLPVIRAIHQITRDLG